MKNRDKLSRKIRDKGVFKLAVDMGILFVVSYAHCAIVHNAKMHNAKMDNEKEDRT